MGQFADLFEQAANISKAHAYDILVEQVKELKQENERLKGVNLGTAFEKLKRGLFLADSERDNKELEPDPSVRYAKAYGALKAYVKDVIEEGEGQIVEIEPKPQTDYLHDKLNWDDTTVPDGIYLSPLKP